MSADEAEGPGRSRTPKAQRVDAGEPIMAATLADWDALVQRLERRLHRYYRLLPASNEERRELVRNVLASVYAAAREASPDTDLAPVVEAVAREEGARYMRRVRHEVPIADLADLPVGRMPDPARSGARERLWEWLEPRLDGLPEVQRVAIERGLDDVADADIAEEAGYKPGSIKTLRNRGIYALRRLANATDSGLA